MNSKGNTMATMDGEHMNFVELARIYNEGVEEGKRQVAQPAPVVPDVMTTAEGEHPEYVQGWNDCRQLMLQTRNNRHD